MNWSPADSRKRLFDLATPWIWVLIFWNGHQYDEPFLAVEVWGPHRLRGWWFHANWRRREKFCRDDLYRGLEELEPQERRSDGTHGRTGNDAGREAGGS